MTREPRGASQPGRGFGDSAMTAEMRVLDAQKGGETTDKPGEGLWPLDAKWKKPDLVLALAMMSTTPGQAVDAKSDEVRVTRSNG